MRALVIALALIGTPAAAAGEQFDLVCEGRFKPRINARWRPTESRYRIDLSTSAWCNGQCTEVRQIASIETGKIILSRSSPGERLYALHELDRVAGTYQHYFSGGLSFHREEGRCTVAPFSGFPSARF